MKVVVEGGKLCQVAFEGGRRRRRGRSPATGRLLSSPWPLSGSVVKPAAGCSGQLTTAACSSPLVKVQEQVAAVSQTCTSHLQPFSQSSNQSKQQLSATQLTSHSPPTMIQISIWLDCLEEEGDQKCLKNQCFFWVVHWCVKLIKLTL